MRIEDLDRERSKPVYVDHIMRDFEALGLTWDVGPIYQSDRNELYENAFRKLCARDLVYPCFCTRADLNAQSAPHPGERRVYNGRCRNLSEDERASVAALCAQQGRRPAMRLCVHDENIAFEDMLMGRAEFNVARDCGDFVIKRSDGGFAYQLAVVVDDAEQGVNMIVRGCDLVDSTPQQIYLQHHLGFETPRYAHVPLLCAPDGRRLAKRNTAAAYDEFLSRFGTPEAVLGHVAFIGGLIDEDTPVSTSDLLCDFRMDDVKEKLGGKKAIIFDIA